MWSTSESRVIWRGNMERSCESLRLPREGSFSLFEAGSIGVTSSTKRLSLFVKRPVGGGNIGFVRARVVGGRRSRRRSIDSFPFVARINIQRHPEALGCGHRHGRQWRVFEGLHVKTSQMPRRASGWMAGSMCADIVACSSSSSRDAPQAAPEVPPRAESAFAVLYSRV